MAAVNEAITDDVQSAIRSTRRYQVVTDLGALRGEPFDALTDEDALDVVRARRRAGNLPLAPFRLETADGRVVGSWQHAIEVQ